MSQPMERRPLAALVIATLVTCTLGWLFKAHCQFDGGWNGSEQFTTGCYSDIIPFWGQRGVSAGEVPYFQTPIEYPVLTGLAIWIEGTVTHLLFGADAVAIQFLTVATAVNAGMAVIVTLLLERIGLPRGRLWLWAVAPPLILYVGHNWDLVAIVFAVGAMLFARRDQPVRAAAMAGFGVAAKLFPVVMLPVLVLRQLFARRIGVVALAALAAIAAWAVVNLPVVIGAFANWSAFYRFSQGRPGTTASLWRLADHFGWPTTIPDRNLYAALLFVAGMAAIIGFGWRHCRDRPWTLATPILAWFLLTNKVYSPQFDLWLYPLLLITTRDVRPILVFVIGDLLAYFAEMWMFAGQDGAWPSAGQPQILLAVLIRAAAILWIIVDAVSKPPPDWTATDRIAA